MNELDGVIRLLDEATIEPGRWPVALARLAEVIDGAGAHLVIVDKYTDGEPRPCPRFKTIGVLDLDADVADRYMSGWREQDPLLSVAFDASGSPGTVLRCHDFLSEDFVNGSAYFQDFLIPAGGRYQTGITLANDLRHVAVLDIHTRESPVSHDQLERLQPVVSHLLRSVELSRRLAVPLARGELLKEALRHLGIACLVLNEQMQILESSTAAAFMLEEGTLIRVDPSGRLRLANPARSAAVEDAVSSACTGGKGAVVRVLSHSVHTVVRIIPAGLERANPFNPDLSNCALVFLETSAEPVVASVRRIEQAFQCSRAEAQIARALASGCSPKEIAAKRGRSIHTTRAQIRVLLQLTGCHRIAELVAKTLHLRDESPGLSSDPMTAPSKRSANSHRI